MIHLDAGLAFVCQEKQLDLAQCISKLKKTEAKMNKTKTLKLFNREILDCHQDEAIRQIFDQDRQTVAFLNAHCINVAASDPIYRWALSKATTLLPDGSGMQLAAKLIKSRFTENLNGTDLFPPIISAAASRKMKVFFFGSRPGIAEKAADAAKVLNKDVQIAGSRNGFFSARDEAGIIETINASGADVLLVGMGVPMQDIWIARNRHRLNAKVVFGVGAQFDFWSGSISRAPRSLRRFGMEWLWRLAIEPKRMFSRYVVGNPVFIGRSFFSSFKSQFPSIFDNFAKRSLDLILSGGALVGLLPLIGLIALAIKLESKGSVFFTQLRVGQHGKQFKIYKFRSMYLDAEARRQAVLHLSERKGVCFKSKNDPRITRVGKILRRLSLDELPQILNVWKGDMAIVGPRPALPQEVAAYPKIALSRLESKPGLTGLWQVSGRAEVDFDRMINMDLAYGRTRNIFSDIAMIALTFRALITGRGAY